MFSQIIKHRTTSENNWRQEIQELVHLIRNLNLQYPRPEDKIRLFEEFEKFAVVSSLSAIPKFHTLFEQRIYSERDWPGAPEIIAMVSNLADSMLKLQKDFS